MLRNIIKHKWHLLWRHLYHTLTLNKFLLSVSPHDYGLIQIYCHKYSFVLLLWFGLKYGKLINQKSSKKYEIKENLLFFSKYQLYVISWVENIGIFTRATLSWKFWCFQHTWWNIFGIHLKKRKYPLYLETSTCDALHYIMGSPILIVPFCRGKFHQKTKCDFLHAGKFFMHYYTLLILKMLIFS